MSMLRSAARRLAGGLTYANVVATVALVLVVGSGGAYAASHLVNGKTIKPGTVRTAQLGDGAVTAPKLAPGLLTVGSTGPQGVPGATGATGPQGDPGAQGTKGEKGDPGTADTSNVYDKAASDARFQAAFDHVKVVGGGSPGANGDALLAALAAIGTPSGPDDAWVVKLLPGTFDIGTRTVVLKPYLDLEGSGIGVTRLTTSSAAGSGQTLTTVSAASSSEVRDLTIASVVTTAAPQGNSTVAVGLGNGVTRFSVRNAALVATGGSFAQALLVNSSSSSVVVQHSSLIATSSGTNAQAFALDTFGGAVTVRWSDLNASVTNGGLAGVGLILQGAGTDPQVFGSVVTASTYAFYSSTSSRIRAGNSQLAAPMTVSGPAVCINTFKLDYTATSAACA